MKNFTLVEIKYDASNFQDCNVFLTGKELTARKIALQTLKTHTEHTGYSHPVFALCLCYMEENKVSGLKLLYLGTFKFVIIASLSIFNFYFYLFRQGGQGMHVPWSTWMSEATRRSQSHLSSCGYQGLYLGHQTQ